MEQEAGESWFYTQNGERHGPVPFELLQQKVRNSELDSSSEMVWKQGMPNWSPLGEMQGVFLEPESKKTEPTPVPLTSTPVPLTSTPASAASAPAPAASTPAPAASTPAPAASTPAPAASAPAPAASVPAPAARPTSPNPRPPAPNPTAKPAPKPAAPSKPPASAQGLQWPGARRRSYIVAALIFPIIWSALFPLAASPLIALVGPDLSGLVFLVGILIPVIFAIAFKLMRISNLGMSRWWFLASFVPLLNLWLAYRCFACPAGYASHKKMDGIGIFLAILFWLFLVLIIAGSVVAVAIGFNMMADDPEFRETLRNFIEQIQTDASQP